MSVGWTGARVRALREALGYTQSRLSAVLGIHALTVSRWERQRAAPGPEQVRMLLVCEEALHKDPEGLPRRLDGLGADPTRALCAILATVYPDVALDACDRVQLRRWLAADGQRA